MGIESPAVPHNRRSNRSPALHELRIEMKSLSKSIGVLRLALVLTAATAWAGSEKISPDMQSRNSAAHVEVIVQYKVPPTGAHHQKIESLGGNLSYWL